MENLYTKNGLVVWDEEEISLRDMFVSYFSNWLKNSIQRKNPAVSFHRCEVSQLTPTELIKYDKEDYFQLDNELSLRPETTMWTYAYIKEILNPHKTKYKLPICIYQHWKSFRREQDKVQSNMRLKEFYQLEYQFVYTKDTKDDYYWYIVKEVKDMFSKFFDVRTEPSDRLPYYSIETTDIINNKNNMELCSISHRTDFPNIYPITSKELMVVEVAIGTDRLIYNFNNRTNGEAN